MDPPIAQVERTCDTTVGRVGPNGEDQVSPVLTSSSEKMRPLMNDQGSPRNIAAWLDESGPSKDLRLVDISGPLP